MREVNSDNIQVDLNICTKELCSCGDHICEHFCGARGTELLQCQGHRTLLVPGAQNFCGAGAHVDCIATTVVLDPVGSAKSFIFHHDPSLNQSWGTPILITILLLLNCNYLASLCTFQGFKSFNISSNISSNF